MWVRDLKVAARSFLSIPPLPVLGAPFPLFGRFVHLVPCSLRGSFCTFVERPRAYQVPTHAFPCSRVPQPPLSFSSMPVPRLLQQNVLQYFLSKTEIIFLHEYFIYVYPSNERNNDIFPANFLSILFLEIRFRKYPSLK